MSKQIKLAIGLLLMVVGLGLISIYTFSMPTEEIPPARLHAQIQKQEFDHAKVGPTIYPGIYSVELTARVNGKNKRLFSTSPLDESELKLLYAKPSTELDLPGHGMKQQVLAVIPSLVIGGLVIFLLVYQVNIGRSKKKHRVRQRPTTRFAEVAGCDEAKAEVAEVVDFLKNPKKYKKFGSRLPKGVLLIGPPGTGKTLLAKAIAGEAQANFFSAHGSDFNEVFVGVGAKRIRDLFHQASKNSPAIIFIDEIDCLGKKRKNDGHGELQQTNNALLAAMDGFESANGVVVIAATNRPEDLDDALTRPGRFDRKVHVLLPDMKGRRAILDAHCAHMPIANKNRTLDVIAQSTHEMSGADLSALVNEASIHCARNDMEDIGLAALEQARDKVRWGKERTSMVLNPEERAMVAYHEAGHTIVTLRKSLLPPLYKVSIIPRGGALGVTTMLPVEDQNIHSKTFLIEELAVLMGGRAAERSFFGATTNGAHGDLDSAKKIARSMIHDWGMGQRLYYQAEQQEAEVEINRLLEAADAEARHIVETERDNTHKLAQALLIHETLTRDEVVKLLAEPRKEAKPVVEMSLN